MANTLNIVRAPDSHLLTDKAGSVAAEVVSSAASAGQTGLVVYPVPSAAVTPTQDSADGTVGSTAPTVGILACGVDVNGNLKAIGVEASAAAATGRFIAMAARDSSTGAIRPLQFDNFNAGLVVVPPGGTSTFTVNLNQVSGASAAAEADAIANPTTFKLGNIPHLFNGTSWDRNRGNWDTSTGDTGTKTTTFNGATQTNYDAVSAYITILLGTVSGTGPSLVAQLQWSPDAGTTWLNLGAAMSALNATSQTGTFVVSPRLLTGLTTGATQSVLVPAPLPRTWRVTYTITGTNPSFAISSVRVNYTK